MFWNTVISPVPQISHCPIFSIILCRDITWKVVRHSVLLNISVRRWKVKLSCEHVLSALPHEKLVPITTTVCFYKACATASTLPLSSTLWRHSFNMSSHLNSCPKGFQARSCSAIREISHCKLRRRGNLLKESNIVQDFLLYSLSDFWTAIKHIHRVWSMVMRSKSLSESSLYMTVGIFRL